MRFLKTLAFRILATGLVFALPVWAQQKSVGPSGAGPGLPTSPGQIALPGVPQVACGTRGRIAAATPPTAEGLTDIGVKRDDTAPS